MFTSLLGGSRKSALLRAGLLIPAIAVVDWLLVNELPLGFLYILPMLIVGRVLRPWLIACVALLCTVLAELFDPFVWHLAAGIPRDILYFSSFFCVGMFVYEVSKNRQVVLGHLHEIETAKRGPPRGRGATEGIDREQSRRHHHHQSRRMRSSGERGRTSHVGGRAEYSRRAAPSSHTSPPWQALLHRDPDHQLFRAVMQSRAQREDGEVFLAEICFSTYRTNSGLAPCSDDSRFIGGPPQPRGGQPAPDVGRFADCRRGCIP